MHVAHLLYVIRVEGGGDRKMNLKLQIFNERKTTIN